VPGCATGEEAYSLAMLLDRVLPPGVPWTVEGSDLDERSLETARAARYPARVLPDIAAVGPARGTVSPAGFEVAAELRARVRFRRDDLTAPAARGPFDLVLCRNVLIYFGPEGQALALASLARALAPGGLLVLGRAELPARTAAAGLAVVDARERIYRRVP
jgi:chemotaxis methyl-accepting protein methylase